MFSCVSAGILEFPLIELILSSFNRYTPTVQSTVCIVSVHGDDRVQWLMHSVLVSYLIP